MSGLVERLRFDGSGHSREAADEIDRLRAALAEISEGRGTYSRDRLEHASNCIEEMKGIAKQALADNA